MKQKNTTSTGTKKLKRQNTEKAVL